MLQTTLLDKRYNGGFICSQLAVGVHKVLQELVGILAGEGRLHVINIDPRSSKFMELMHKMEMPSKRIDPQEEREDVVYHNERVEPVTSIQFDPFTGAFVQFYNGFFKVYEPIHFKEIWHQECVDVQSLEKQLQQKQKGKRNDISIICSDLSVKLQFLALGGQQGNILVYDVTSQSFFSSNSDVHANQEIVKLFFFDD